jgi:hypothetical protein
VRLVPDAVAGLLGRRSVEAQAVRLDDQAQLGPVEVDLESVDPHAGLRLGKSEVANNAKEAAFELRVSEREGPALENRPQSPHARLARRLVEARPERFGIAQAELVRFVDRRLERLALEP